MKIKYTKIIIPILTVLMFLLTNTGQAFAANPWDYYTGSGWTITKPDNRTGLYEIPDEALPNIQIDIPQKTSTNKPTTTNSEDEENFLVKGIRTLFNKVADMLYMFMKPMGIDIDTIIYNRNASTGTESKFMVDFSETSKSPFSVMGNMLYKVFKSIALFIMFIVLLFIGSKFQMSVTSKNKVEVKETLNNYVVSFMLIFFMPGILNLALFLSNMVVDGLNPAYVKGLGSFTATLSKGETLADATIYLGTVVLSLYFVAMYATRALHITLFYFMFPIMATYMNGSKYKQNFSTYISDLVSTITVQIFDAALFLGLTVLFSPAGAFSSVEYAGFWKLVIAAAVVPLRAIAKKMIGLSQSNTGADMLGFAGLMGAVGLTKGFVGGARNVVSGVGSGISDIRNANKQYRAATADYSPDSKGSSSVSSGGSTNLNTPMMNNSIPLEAPKVTPYVSRVGNTNGTTFGPIEHEYGSRQPENISQPDLQQKIQDHKEAYKKLKKDGWSKILKSAGSGMGAATLGTVGAGMGSLMGPTGIIFGAQIGGTLGGGIGEGTGALGSLLIQPDIIQRETQNTTQVAETTTKVEATSKNETEANIVVAKSAASENVKEVPIGISAPGVDTAKVMDEYIQNMPDAIKATIERQAGAYADSFVNPLKGSYDQQNLNDLHSKIKTMCMQEGVVNYAFEEMKKDHNVDMGSIDSMSTELKRKLMERINLELSSLNKQDYTSNVNDL